MGDRPRMLGLINAAWTTQVMAAACEIGVPDAMEAPTTAAAIATSTATHAPSIERLLRAMVTLGVCEEASPGVFTLLPDGQLLRSDHSESVSAWARMSGAQIWNNWTLLVESLRTGKSARRAIQGVDDFGYLDASAKKAEVFNAAMVNLTRPVAEAAARAIDWSAITHAMDVGGGAGELLAGILSAHAHMRGTLFDLRHATEGARAHLAKRGVADRCDVVAGSFFEAIPAGADAYLLKSVLHNWDDARARLILQQVRMAARPGAWVMLLERVVPECLTTAPLDREMARSDLNMLVGCGGCERTASAFRDLLSGAGFEFAYLKPLTQEVSLVGARA